MSVLLWTIFLTGWMTQSDCVPFRSEKSDKNVRNFIAEGTNEIATALFQGFVHDENNMVFSPLGYSAVLAVFAEGARGASREEIATALHFPEDVQAVRNCYKEVLGRLASKMKPNSPEFKNWFYIYKNYTVEEELQNVLRSYYGTEVKTVDRLEEPEKRKPTRKPSEIKETEKEKEIEVEKEITSMAESAQKVDAEEAASNNQQALLADKPTKEKNSVKPETTDKIKDDNADDCVKESETVAKVESVEKTETKESENVEKEEEKEVMIAMQRNGRDVIGPLDHVSGMTDSFLKLRGNDPLPQMIIFNGLYYRGEWEVPFVKKPADDSRAFYVSEKKKIYVPTIHSEGLFNAGNIQHLDCKAIELPYKGGIYSLLILVPNSRDGLTKLVSELTGYPISKIYEQMTKKQLEVCLPSFDISTISKPVSSFSRLGLSKVTTIFDPVKADLSGISKNPGLYVEELVQMVTFKVDAKSSAANFLTASLASSRTEFEKFQINQPFLFYLRDNRDDVVIVNGKIVDPTPQPDLFHRAERKLILI